MPKILIGLAAVGVTAMLALPVPAVAKDRPADGIRNMEQLEVSSARRKKRRYVRHYYAPRYYGGPYYGGPYYGYDAYAYSPYYRAPGPHIGVGPWGFSFGFGY